MGDRSVHQSNMDGLPIEIISSILSWLPVKSALKCRSVCKTWCSIVDHPEFGNTHFLNSSMDDDPSSLILIEAFYNQILFIIEDYSEHAEDPRILKPRAVHIPIPDYSPVPLLVGFSHGLLCLSYYHARSFPDGDFCNIFICNPATMECERLPGATIEPAIRHGWKGGVSGFGFDYSTEKFKVVFIYHYGFDEQSHSEVQVYTLGSNSWRTVNHHFPGYELQDNSLVCVSGSLHWLAHVPSPEPVDGGNLQSPIRIVSFDLEHEDFGIVPNPEFENLPNLRSYDDDYDPQIALLGSCLCLSDFSYQNDCFDIWVMNQYNVRQSWTKRYVIPNPFMNRLKSGVVRPVLVQKNGNLVFLHDSNSLFSYNLENGTSIPLEDDQLPRSGQGQLTYHAFPYVASLISPNYVCKPA